MLVKILRFLSIMFTAVGLGGGLAHLFALPNKIQLPGQDYLIVQQIYRGWALLGIALIGALILTFTLAVTERRRRKVFALVVFALIAITAELATFFAFSYPVNQLTNNWTVLPGNWQQLRMQWEYSHAAGAGFAFLALATLVLSLLVRTEPQSRLETSSRDIQRIRTSLRKTG